MTNNNFPNKCNNSRRKKHRNRIVITAFDHLWWMISRRRRAPNRRAENPRDVGHDDCAVSIKRNEECQPLFRTMQIPIHHSPANNILPTVQKRSPWWTPPTRPPIYIIHESLRKHPDRYSPLGHVASGERNSCQVSDYRETSWESQALKSRINSSFRFFFLPRVFDWNRDVIKHLKEIRLENLVVI